MERKEFKIGDFVCYSDYKNNQYGTGKVVDVAEEYEIEVFPAIKVFGYKIIDDNTNQRLVIVNNGKDGLVDEV